MLTGTSLFCGAGGDTCGAEMVPGFHVRMAANHWKVAVDAHQQNFPDTAHDVADISQVDPRRYPRTHILWASPSCTNHADAKGRKRNVDAQPDLFGDVVPDESAERSRATMWDVIRFTEYHRYLGGVVENVVQLRDWVLWPAWVHAIKDLGYELQVVYMNSMFAQAGGLPAPQSRDRMYVVFWRTGIQRPDFDRWTRPMATCTSCGTYGRAVQAWKRGDRRYGKYGKYGQYVWRCESCAEEVFPPVLPAAAAIDWSIPGERIGDRRKGLSPNTISRIEAGLQRYGQPIHLEMSGNTYEHGTYKRAWPVSEPFKTLHTSNSKGLACPPMLVPVGGTWNTEAVSVLDPFRTRTTRESESLVQSWPTAAMTMRSNSSEPGEAWPCTPVSEPIRTITTKAHQSVVRWDHLVYDFNTGSPSKCLRPVAEPFPTQTTISGDGVLGPDRNLDDCTLRMLEVSEAMGAMSFPRDYKLLGTERDKFKMAGNAVTPPSARDLIACLKEAVTGEPVVMGVA